MQEIFEGKVLRESRAGHLMVPLLPKSFWEFYDSFVPSETAVFSTSVADETLYVKRLVGSRTIRDLMITSGKRPFQRLHRTIRRLRQKRVAADEQESQNEEEMMERRDECWRFPASEAARRLCHLRSDE